MDYRIEEIQEFTAVGYKRNYNFETGENFEKIPAFWQEIMNSEKFGELLFFNDESLGGPLGICANMNESTFDYYIAVPSGLGVPRGLEAITVPTNTYAIFTCAIHEIQAMTKKIFEEWVPTQEFPFLESAPQLEIYPDDKTCEICIPIEAQVVDLNLSTK